MASITLLFTAVPLLWMLWGAYNLYINYQQASKLHVPLVFAPVSPDNPMWIAIQTAFPLVFRHVPFQSIPWIRYCRLGWEFHDRYRTHERLGDAWILVTPNRNWLYVANNEAAADIFSRSRDFGRPVWMLEMLNVFGPNVSTAEGPEWQRQRKLTATPFNETKNPLVWSEALRQAEDMLKSWLAYGQKGVPSTADDSRTLALHVLAFAAFQKSYPFKSWMNENSSDRPTTYRDSLAIILKNVLVILVLPVKAFDIPFLPAKWARVGWAVTEFRRYMLAQLTEEKQLLAQGKQGSGSLISNLLRASDELDQPGRQAGSARGLKPLTQDEILGNVFVFNFAGHDTTAISLGYSMLLMVAHPDVQDWVAEELNHYLPYDDHKLWNYEEVYPKLKRTLAVLLETLRLYNPLPGIPKYTGPSPQTLSPNGHDISIPADTLVVPNLMALHTHPRYWGSDSLVWRPDRWISSPSNPSNPQKFPIPLSTRLHSETITTPSKGSFIAWSEGTRNCPGQKFAKVEFVATFAAIFRKHKAQPARREGESVEEARVRVGKVVKDSNVELLLQMRDPDSVGVVWEKR